VTRLSTPLVTVGLAKSFLMLGLAKSLCKWCGRVALAGVEFLLSKNWSHSLHKVVVISGCQALPPCMSLGTDTLASCLHRGLYQHVLVVSKTCALLDGVVMKLINFEEVLDQA